MKIRWLGWAGVELEADGQTVVIDALADAGAVFAPFGERAAAVPLPPVVPPRPGVAAAALVTHLHRDHADAEAIVAALSPDGVVAEPASAGGDMDENLALVQADRELSAAGVERRAVVAWEAFVAGPFTITALPAVDGLGDPQLSWLVEADGVRVVHCGDTMFHGFWWRIAQRCGSFDVAFLPVNGAVVGFPHRRPPSPFPVAMTPEQAVVAAEILAAAVAVPMHAEGYDMPGAYEPLDGAAERFARAASERGVPVRLPTLGEDIELAASASRATPREP